MKMTTRVAFDNMKYHKSRNILIGIAIILTTMLLFVVPTVGKIGRASCRERVYHDV